MIKSSQVSSSPPGLIVCVPSSCCTRNLSRIFYNLPTACLASLFCQRCARNWLSCKISSHFSVEKGFVLCSFVLFWSRLASFPRRLWDDISLPSHNHSHCEQTFCCIMLALALKFNYIYELKSSLWIVWTIANENQQIQHWIQTFGISSITDYCGLLFYFSFADSKADWF